MPLKHSTDYKEKMRALVARNTTTREFKLTPAMQAGIERMNLDPGIVLAAGEIEEIVRTLNDKTILTNTLNYLKAQLASADKQEGFGKDQI